MLIKKVQIQNYGSLRNISLDGLGDFVVLLGKNGAGKSFLVEAMYHFFVEFNAIGGETAIGTNDYLWYRRVTEEPTRFDLTLELTDNEVSKTFNFPRNFLSIIKKSSSEQAFHRVEISRSIIFNNNWITNFISWAGIEIVKDDQVVTDKLAALIGKPKTLSGYQLAFFTPEHNVDNIGGDRLLLDKVKKVAYQSDGRIDSLASKEVIETVIVYSLPEFQQVTDWREWANNEGYTIAERPPSAEDAPKIAEALTTSVEPSTVQETISRLAQLIRGNFSLLPAARDRQATAGVRQPIVEQSALDALKELSLSTVRKDEQKWHEYRSRVEPLIQKELEPNPQQLLLRDADLRVPPAYVGGGEQAVVAFQWQFLDDKAIFVVEEPENHLHPQLCRQIFKFLKQQSQNCQVFVSTHSPMFADKKAIESNWVMRYEKSSEEAYGESKVKQIETRDDLKLALAELGVLPSDIFLKDFVVFVEGGTEKEAVIPILGSKLGLDMEDNIGVISIGGESKLEQYLKIWLEIMQYAPADYLVILDRHSGELATRLITELNIESSRFHVWQKGSVEDYYPLDIALEALKELFGVEIIQKDIKKREPLDKELKRVLEAQGRIRKGWKVEIGTYVAEKMGIKRIPSEMKNVFQYIKSRTEI